MAGKPGMKRGVSAAALKYLLDHPGEYMRVENLAYELDVTEAQAAAAMVYLIRNQKAPGLKAVQNGHVWVYEPEGGDDGAVHWELVRRTNDDEAILEDAEGHLWYARPVRAI